MRQQGEITGDAYRKKVRKEVGRRTALLTRDGVAAVNPALSAALGLCQKSLKDKTIAWAQNKYFDAKRRFWPKEIHLKPKSEVYWEQVETDQRNFHFLAE